MLYYDTRLSAGDDVSCNSCHALDDYAASTTSASPSATAASSGAPCNAPTVYNAAGFFTQFWDGRAPNVEEQAKGPILNPVEMGDARRAPRRRGAQGRPRIRRRVS